MLLNTMIIVTMGDLWQMKKQYNGTPFKPHSSSYALYKHTLFTWKMTNHKPFAIGRKWCHTIVAQCFFFLNIFEQLNSPYNMSDRVIIRFTALFIMFWYKRIWKILFCLLTFLFHKTYCANFYIYYRTPDFH